MDQWNVSVEENWRLLRPVWERLQANENYSPFQHFEWVSNWYQIAIQHGLGTALVVHGTRGSDNKQEIVVPLFVYRRFGLTIISAPDLGVSDFFRPLTGCTEAFPDGVLADFFETMSRKLPPHDVLSLARIDDSGQVSVRKGFQKKFVRQAPLSAWHLEFDPAEHWTPDQALSKKFRQTLTRKTRRMAENVERQVKHYWPLRDESLLARVMGMRSRNLQDAGRKDVLSGGPWTELYRKLVETQNAELTVNVTELKADGDPVAYVLGVASGAYCVVLIVTMKRGSLDRYSPGVQVAYECIQEARRRGIRTFDLSIGDQPYKKNLGCRPRPLYTIVVPHSAKGTIAWLLWRARHQLRSFRRSFLK